MGLWRRRSSFLLLGFTVGIGAACVAPSTAPDGGDEGSVDAGCVGCTTAQDAGDGSIGDAGCVPSASFERRCDGADDDCDGVIDERWTLLASRTGESHSWYTPAVRIDAGFIVATAEPDDAWPPTSVLRRYDRELESVGEPERLPVDAKLRNWELHAGGGGPVLTHTRESEDGGLTFAAAELDGTSGALRRGDDGGVRLRTLLSVDVPTRDSWSRTALGADGGVAYLAYARHDGPLKVAAVGLDGALLAPPVLTLLADAGEPLRDLSLLVLPSTEVLLIGVDPAPGGARLRVARFDALLNPSGPELTRALGEDAVASLQARVVQGSQGSDVVVAYPTRVDAGAELRIVDALLAGSGARAWTFAPASGWPWFDLEGRDGAVELGGKVVRWDALADGGHEWRGTIVRGRTSEGGARLTYAPPAELPFPDNSRPGVNLIEGFDGWMHLLLPVKEADGGMRVGAYSYCAAD